MTILYHCYHASAYSLYQRLSHFKGQTICTFTFCRIDLMCADLYVRPCTELSICAATIVYTICYVAANAFVRCGIHVFTSFLSNRPNGYIDIIKKGGTIYSKSFLLFLPSIDICKNTSAPQQSYVYDAARKNERMCSIIKPNMR